MRDIRDDLYDRLMAVQGQIVDAMAGYDERLSALNKEHRLAIEILEHEHNAVRAMLTIEAKRAAQAEPMTAPSTARLPFADFLIAQVYATGPLDKDALRTAAGLAGYLDDSNGRSLHACLMNAVKHGKLNQLSDGRYVFPNPADDSLFGVGRHREVPPPVMQ